MHIVLESQTLIQLTMKQTENLNCGVVTGGAVELWSRSGWTDQTVSATRFASEQGGVLELVVEVQQSSSNRGVGVLHLSIWGGRIQLRYNTVRQRLILLAVRDRVTGDWLGYKELEGLCERHKVELVRRFNQLE